MSPRAARRLAALGFEHVYDYAAGKADWLAHGLPREGRSAGDLYAGDIVDAEPAVCSLTDDVAAIKATLEGSGYRSCLVVNERRIVLGRVRGSALREADPGASAEHVMEPGPGTVRAHVPAAQLLQRLVDRNLESAIVTTPEGRLLGVFKRADAERRLQGSGSDTT